MRELFVGFVWQQGADASCWGSRVYRQVTTLVTPQAQKKEAGVIPLALDEGRERSEACPPQAGICFSLKFLKMQILRAK